MYLNIIVTAVIIFSIIIFFILAVIANGLTKSPENIELPAECSSCKSSCIIKFDHSKKSNETIQEFYENCEEKTNENKEEN